MLRIRFWSVVLWLLLSTALSVATTLTARAQDAGIFTFALVLNGRADDNGWNTTHYLGACGTLEFQRDTRMVVYALEGDNTRRWVTDGETCRDDIDGGAQSVELTLRFQELVVDALRTEEGIRLMIVTDPAFEQPVIDAASALEHVQIARTLEAEGNFEAAAAARAQATQLNRLMTEAAFNLGDTLNTLYFIVVNGDSVLTRQAPATVSNLAAQAEWVQLIAGCAAALNTQTSKIGYVSPSQTPETRRQISSAYLGARHCYQTYRAAELGDERFVFHLIWLENMENNQVVTTTYEEATAELTRSRRDVIITTVPNSVGISVAQNDLPALPKIINMYDFEACRSLPEVCLGTMFYNWTRLYTPLVQQAKNDNWQQQWLWGEPDWSNINIARNSVVGFIYNERDTTPASVQVLREFTLALSDYAENPFVPRSFALWLGPLRLQDGTEIASAGIQVNFMDVWYLAEVLQGICWPSLSQADKNRFC
jgi:hypothetical protein